MILKVVRIVFLKMWMHSYTAGSNLWLFVWSFLWFPILCEQAAKALARLPWQPVNSAVWTKFICFVEDYSNISVKHLSKYLLWDSNKCLFHFSHYKSMETLSCHSNESTRATGIKNTPYVEPNVMNIAAKFQLHPSYGFWDDFWIFLHKI